MNVHAIIVTYHPDPAALRLLVEVLHGGNAHVVIVDNTPSHRSPGPAPDHCHVIDMHGNAGIAAAQNAGIRHALANGADVVAFFDQDSTPDAQMLPRLVEALGRPPRGVAAPVCIDRRTGREYPPYRFGRWGWASPAPAARKHGPVEADLIISSGSVVAAEVFERAGLMDEDFFIDYVDLEWCIRCRRAGVPIIVVPSVTMPHAIGDAVVETGPLTTFVHSPIRSYYRLRNAFLLLRKPHVPRAYSLQQIAAVALHQLLQWRHSPDRATHARMGWRGLVDGLRGVRGKVHST